MSKSHEVRPPPEKLFQSSCRVDGMGGMGHLQLYTPSY
jgi:hypothetical protein